MIQRNSIRMPTLQQVVPMSYLFNLFTRMSFISDNFSNKA